MTLLHALILGIVQGITEFLPISSSGHLELFQALLGLEQLDQYLLFDLVCHLGTLLAIFCVYWKEIQALIFSQRERLLQIGIALLPLFPLVLVYKYIKLLFDRPEYLGFFFLGTALILYLGEVFGKVLPTKTLQKNRWRDALFIGLWQALALIPGISRSGSTISGARLLGWKPLDAVTFSFLLAVPTILGGAAVEWFRAFFVKGLPFYPTLPWSQYCVGFFASFIVGYGALRLLIEVAAKGTFMYFVWYCIVIGTVSLLYFR